VRTHTVPEPVVKVWAEEMCRKQPPRALRQHTVDFAAKHLVDMRYVSRLDRTPPPSGISAATGRSVGRPRLLSRARRSRSPLPGVMIWVSRRISERISN
jgi:hypothetical protein